MRHGTSAGRRLRAAYLLSAVGLLVLAGGCLHPAKVCTDSRISLTGPVTANVSADLRPNDAGPVRPMIVQQGAGCSRSRVALVDVDGLLVNANLTGPYSASENPVALLCERLDAVAADPSVCAVVVRINTPGGGVAASDLMRQQLLAFRGRTGLPVVACLMDLATGGGYYLATAADLIYAQPTTITGGIGVIFNLYNLQDAMAQVNVAAQPIKSGQYIDMGTSLHLMTPEAQDWLQAMADEFHLRFRQAVLDRRPAVRGDDPTNFDGRVFTAGQALSRGLVDQVGYLDDAIRAAAAQAGRDRIEVVMFHRHNDPARSPFAITANTPGMTGVIPLSIPGMERSKLPTFLYLWQVDPTLERRSGQ